VRFGVKMSADVPMITQERAYTSPIWYTPSAVEHFRFGSKPEVRLGCGKVCS
jgi:hypothetical protein